MQQDEGSAVVVVTSWRSRLSTQIPTALEREIHLVGRITGPMHLYYPRWGIDIFAVSVEARIYPKLDWWKVEMEGTELAGTIGSLEYVTYKDQPPLGQSTEKTIEVISGRIHLSEAAFDDLWGRLRVIPALPCELDLRLAGLETGHLAEQTWDVNESPKLLIRGVTFTFSTAGGPK